MPKIFALRNSLLEVQQSLVDFNETAGKSMQSCIQQQQNCNEGKYFFETSSSSSSLFLKEEVKKEEIIEREEEEKNLLIEAAVEMIVLPSPSDSVAAGRKEKKESVYLASLPFLDAISTADATNYVKAAQKEGSKQQGFSSFTKGRPFVFRSFLVRSLVGWIILGNFFDFVNPSLSHKLSHSLRSLCNHFSFL